MKDSGPDAEVSEAGRSFECPVCRRAFGYKHVLQNHERTHTGEKPFECPECHKRFTRDHHLKTHLRLHTGERPYWCPHCERHFVQVANLRRHLRVHTGERPYACGACEARFSDSNQLRAHTLIHRGEKPFQCSECAGRFRRRHHLAHHKCPKDEANAGRPRRGRRPKAYDKEEVEDERSEAEEDKSPLVVSDENSMSEDIANNHASDDSGVADTPQQSSPNSNHSADDKTVEVTVVIAKGGNGVGANHCLVSGSVSGVVESNNHLATHNGVIRHDRLVDAAATTLVNGNSHLVTNKIVDVPIHGNLRIPDVGNHQDRLSLRIPDNHQDRFNHHRRKPSRTVRILTPQQREMFLRDKVSMQTQAIDMSLSPSSEDTCSRVAPVTVIVPNRFLGAVEGVLDLSSSRSDSDMEDCPPCRPPSQRITSKVLEPLNGRSPWRHLPGSDDSNGSHANEDDLPLSVIRLTTKKVHVATA